MVFGSIGFGLDLSFYIRYLQSMLFDTFYREKIVTIFDTEMIASMSRGIVDNLQAGLFRSGYSSIIRESHDASCAILLADGSLAAQKVVLPIHIGAFPAVVTGVLKHYHINEIAPGDVFLTNSPWEGGSPHSPDFAVVVPVFVKEQLVAFAASIAHKSDIGGAAPGSCPATARDTFCEGLHIPPIKLLSRGKKNREVFSLLRGNSRSPHVVLGDLEGQVGVCGLGGLRVQKLFERFGSEQTFSAFKSQRHATQQLIVKRLTELDDFNGFAERLIDHDGIDLNIPKGIRVRVYKQGANITFDFSETDQQGSGPINVRPHLVKAACSYVMIAITGIDTPVNQGVFDTFEIITKQGTLVDPYFPAPVNTYNPALHAIIESIFAAFGDQVPEFTRADGGGGRALTFAHKVGQDTLIQYELFAGGVGAMADYPGETGCHCNQTNGKITAIEMLETEFPIRVERFMVRDGSGGEGRFRGGNGFLREYRILDGLAAVTLRSSKHAVRPQGINGGDDGEGGFCQTKINGETIMLASMQSGIALNPNDTLTLGTPGGGGFGRPF